MKRWLLSCSFVIFALWLCLPSVCAGVSDGKASATSNLSAKCKETLPKAEEFLKDPKRKIDDCKNPETAILASEALVDLWKLAGCPESKAALPFEVKDSDLAKALRWAAEDDNRLLKALGYEPESKTAKEDFRKKFPKMKLRNRDAVSLFYQYEWKRRGKAPNLPKNANATPYKDVPTLKKAPKEEKTYVSAVLWAGVKTRNLIDGVTIADVTKLIDYLLSGNW